MSTVASSGCCAVRIDLRLYAREIARGIESPHVPVQRGFAVRLAGLDRAEVVHERRLRTSAVPRSRTCRSGTPDRWRARARDPRLRARGRSRLRSSRCAPRHRDCRRASRARAPSRSSTRLAGSRSPSGRPQPPVSRATASVPSGMSVAAGPVTTMRTDAMRVGVADVHAERHRDGIGGTIDLDVDPRRKIALGRRHVAGLVDRLARETVEEVVRHLRVALPAHEADVALQDFLERRRRDDRDAIRKRDRAVSAVAAAAGAGSATAATAASAASGHERAIESVKSHRTSNLREVARRHRRDYPRSAIRSGCNRPEARVARGRPTLPIGRGAPRGKLRARARGQLGNVAPRRVEIPVHARRIAEPPQSDADTSHAGGVVADRASRARKDACERKGVRALFMGLTRQAMSTRLPTPRSRDRRPGIGRDWGIRSRAAPCSRRTIARASRRTDRPPWSESSGLRVLGVVGPAERQLSETVP